MLMPSTVASPLPTVMSPGQATTMSTMATSTPTITSTIQSLQQKDTTWTKLFVGGLPYHTTDKSLREHFEVYGEIEEAVVITDRSTGKSRGYGFVIMANKEAADRALKEPNPIIDGRKANVNLAILGAKPRGNITAQLPLTALRPGFPALLGQYGQPMAAQTAGSPYLQQLYAASASPYMAAAAGQVNPNMMQLMGGQVGMAGTTGNPLLDMYAGQYAAMGYAPAGSAAVAGGGGAGCAVSAASGVLQPTAVSQSLSLDASQAQAQAQANAVAGGYLGFYAPALTAQQLTAAGISAAAAGLPAAYAAAPTAATTPTAAQQAQPAETRTQ